MLEKLKLNILILTILTTISLALGCGKKELVIDPETKPVRIAVESSFLPTAKILALDFTSNTEIAVQLTDGSNEELVNIILEGGDYDVFMASDVEHPQSLIEQGKAKGDGALVYAYGITALYTKDWKVHWTAPEYLFSGQFSTLGVANPEDNRYGEAGIALLKNIDVYKSLESKIVYTDNEQATLDQIKARQIDAGFIAFSSLSDRNKRWAWIVPQKVYDPIEQGAVLITKESTNHSAEIWMGYLNSEGAQSIIQQSGYGIAEAPTVSSSQ